MTATDQLNPQTIICKICKNEMRLYSINSFLKIPTYHCLDCESYYTFDNTLEEKINQLYKNQYWNDRESEMAILSNYTDINSQGKRRNFISQFEYVKPYLRKNILEIGVGAGQTIYWLTKMGYNVTGIEPDIRNVELINNKIGKNKVMHNSIENISLDKKYEFIWMSHVLEHLTNPDSFLRMIQNNLIDNGILFIEVPNCENPETLSASIFENPHIYHFSRKALKRLCDDFNIISLDCFRPATKLEAVIQKITKIFKYYPRIKDDNGRDMRIILKKKTKINKSTVKVN